jgi:hypothetical protein
MDAAGDHADPGHPSRTAACPTAALQDPHFGRTQRTRQRTNTGRPHRTPTPDAGQRTPGRSDARTGPLDIGPVDRQAWTLVARTGHRTPDTGHRTLAEDMDRLTKARPGIRTSWATTPSDARWDAQPCSCGRRLRRSAAHAGSAVRPPSSARYRLAGSCLVARRGRCQRRPRMDPLATRARTRASSGGQFSRAVDSRAAPRRTAVLGRLRVERRANGEASSVMASAFVGLIQG